MANRAKSDRREDDLAGTTPEEEERTDPSAAHERNREREEVGAPATEGDAPPVEELVPGIDEVLNDGSETAESRVAEMEAETRELKDKLLRTLAELENTRRRAERDRRDAEAYGGTRLARDMLVVYDNLNRALAAADDELREKHGPFLQGVELTQRELLSAFSRHKIERVSPERGSRFDPHLHQAMFEAPVPGAENGTIIEVMEDGFTIADRLLRPARVGVAKGGEAVRPGGEATEPGADADERRGEAGGG